MLRSSGQLSKLGDKHKQPDLAQAHGIDRARPHSAKTCQNYVVRSFQWEREVERRRDKDGERRKRPECKTASGAARSLGRRWALKLTVRKSQPMPTQKQDKLRQILSSQVSLCWVLSAALQSRVRWFRWFHSDSLGRIHSWALASFALTTLL